MNAKTLDSKVWFVTGASSGFGWALAEHALSRGHRVVATARSLAALSELAERDPARVALAELDVTQPAQVRRALSVAFERFGRIDVLVNNAGYGLVGAVEETSDAELRAAMDAMFFGAVSVTREALPTLRRQKSGTIVQITSMGGLMSVPGFGAYCAAKHALEGLSEALAAELAPLGIRVLIVEPGAFRTRLFGAAFRRMPVIEDYAASVGATRAYSETAPGTEPGDPAKAARAIADAVDAGAPTLR
ncbi:MAG: SDR family NAD(P)-dependent oxidoreductase, partial [Myxococcota bacterium]|nr:SDR family NAD(P)-dependent oxidoreductase [Myxococcota bacterium]